MGNIYRTFYCTLGLLLCSGTSHTAAGSDLAINANVVASPCMVGNESLSQDVNLGKFWTSNLAKAGDSTEWKAFSVKLNNCPPTTAKVIATFTGTPDPIFPAYFQNTGGSQHVAIEIAEASGNVKISSGSNITEDVDSSGNVSFNLKGRMVTPAGGATSGSVRGLLEVVFAYR